MVEGKGLKTRYSNVVAMVKLITYQAQSRMNAFFHRFDMRIFFLMAPVTI